jgi:TRAP-type C4-dicarboxylate transport system permease large subunit
MLAYNAVPQEIVGWLRSVGFLGSQLHIFVAVVVILLAVGTFMDAIPAIIILQPIIGEMAAAGGIDPYHMGVVVVLTLAIGLITPPYGLCLLIAADLAEISVRTAMRALLPFYLISLCVVVIAVLLPDLILWIPRSAMANPLSPSP